ncbi:MAG: efflux RND transporter permease subunit, partial [Phycisphaerales bacterium JB038]
MTDPERERRPGEELPLDDPGFLMRFKEFAPTSFAVDHRTSMVVLLVIIGILGLLSYQTTPKESFPEIEVPMIAVNTLYPGVSPADMESLITRPLEDELSTISEIKELTSSSTEGYSSVVAEFETTVNMEDALQKVREKVDLAKPELPAEAEEPSVMEFDFTEVPIMQVNLSGDYGLVRLKDIADDLQDRLEQIPELLRVDVRGGLEREVKVDVDLPRLQFYGLALGDVIDAIAAENVNIPGGSIDVGRSKYLVRVDGEFEDPSLIEDLVITAEIGRPVYVRDVASVDFGFAERDSYARLDGSPVITLDIIKRSGENIIATSEAVKEVIAEFDPLFPPSTVVKITGDQSVDIEMMVSSLENNILSGLILIVAVLLFFLGLANSGFVAVSIPSSMLLSFIVLKLMGVSMNMVVLFSLILALGMLVDNAIVVLESIFRCREEGDPLATAVVRGVSEVGMAVTASTATTVAVFFPIVFVEGVAGQVFGDMALTVVFSLIASLLAALFFIPMLASRDFTTSGEQLAGHTQNRPFLQFPTPTDADSWFTRARLAGLSIGHLLLRTLTALLVLLALAAKVVLAPLAILFSPLIWLVGHRRTPTRWQQTATWFARDRFGPLPSERVWPGLLSVPTLVDLQTGLRGLGRWVAGHGGWVGRIARAFIWPLAFLFWLLRSGFSLIVRLISTLFQVIALLIAAAVIVLVRIVVLLASPVVNPVLAAFNHGFNLLQNTYPPVLRAALRHRWSVIGVAVGLFAVCWFALLPRLGRELIPQVQQGEFNLDITLPVGTPIEHTYQVARGIEDVLLADDAVALTAVTAGAEDNATRVAEAGEHTARITVRLAPHLGPRDEQAVINRIRAEFADYPELSMEVTYPALFSFKSPVEVEIRGYQLDLLKSLAQTAESRLAEIPGLVDVRSSLQTGNPEIRIIYNRAALAEYGLSLRTVAELVRDKVQGSVATEYRQAERLIDILVRLEEKDRLGLSELSQLIVNPGGAIPIPLSAVADLRVNEGPSEIRRIDQTRSAVIYANLSGADLATVSRDIVTVMRDLDYPPGFDFAVSGQNEEMQTSLNSLLLAFALALFLVYIVMASQFESLVQPFLIMMTVPLALIGVISGLFLLNITISIMVFIGLIILAGIVVNNAIVLIDYIDIL